MRAMMLMKSDAKIEAGEPPSAREIAELGAFNDAMTKAGVLLAGEGLYPSAQGVRVTWKRGKLDVVDGPFTGSKELVAGYWLLETKSRAEALDWLARAPAADGRVELRPLYGLEDFPVSAEEQPGGWRDQEVVAREEMEAKPPTRKPGTKRFILLLKADAVTEAGAPPNQQVLTEMGALMNDMLKAETILGGDGLKPSSLGARLRVANGERSTVDGPFAESKELIAGYTLVQMATIAEAVEFAMRWLSIHAKVGVEECEIEVRELMS